MAKLTFDAEGLRLLADPPVSSGGDSLAWTFQTNATIQYIAGFYDFSGTDDDFSPSINWGVAGVGVAAHFMIVTGAVAVDRVVVRVTGTSITDLGVQTGGDSEDIVIPEGTPVNSFFETSKKWNGQVTVETISGTPVTCNYGWDKYHDHGNIDFTVDGLECLWESDATDNGSNIVLIHHKADGWTFNAGADPDPPVLASRNADHPGMTTHRVGSGAWKRTNIDQLIRGSKSEGVLLCVQSGSTGLGSLSFRLMTIELSLRHSPTP